VLESAAAADTVLTFEKKLAEQFPPDKKYAFEARNGVITRSYSSAYTIAYHNMLNGMVERRMQQSIHAVASFWYTAWIDAGQPNMALLLETPVDTADIKEMELLNDAWKKAFEMYKETGKYGPPEELNMDIGDTRGLFKAGRCGILIEWGDPGPMSIEKDAGAIKDKLYAVSGLGWKEVLDRKTGKLVPVTKENAPSSVDGINYAPFAAFGGWAGAVNGKADAKKKAASYAFLSYMNQAAQSNIDVTIGWTGYNAYRISQLKDTTPWVAAGFSKEAAENYLGAINGALANPNMASDFKIPGAQSYSGVVLDRELARYLAGEITVDEALANIEAGWEEITEDFGRDNQIKAQGLALGTGK